MIDNELRQIKKGNNFSTIFQEIDLEIKYLENKKHLFKILELIQTIEKYRQNGVFTQFDYHYINVSYGYNDFTEDNMLYLEIQQDNAKRSPDFNQDPAIVYDLDEEDEVEQHEMFKVMNEYRSMFIQEMHLNTSIEEDKQYIFKIDETIGENILSLLVTDEMKSLYTTSLQKINLEDDLPINSMNAKKVKI